MGLTLHEALVPNWMQMIAGLERVLEKGAAWAKANGKSEEDIAALRLTDDMNDFAYQIKAARIHSIIAVEAARTGTFSPDLRVPPRKFGVMKAQLIDTFDRLSKLEAKDLEELGKQPMQFSMQDVTIPFENVQDFLLSFSQPNFYFHVTTAYALLRTAGVPLTKGDYIGPVRKKADAPVKTPEVQKQS